MRILNIEWKAFGNQDMVDALLAEGHDVAHFPFSKEENARDNPEAEKRLSGAIRGESPDAVFSFNFFPIVSKVCEKEGIPYVSWVYDCPHVRLYSHAILNPHNRVYVFDKEVYREFHDAGVPTVRYLPLAANTERLDALGRAGNPSYRYDISFVGALYTEVHQLFDRVRSLPDYARGYLDALMLTQRKIQGYNFIQESLGPVMADLREALPLAPNPDGVETREFLYAQYVINRKITGLERTELLKEITKRHSIDLFTFDDEFTMDNLRNHGQVDPYEGTPQVFKRSKINLNISLRSIKSGIPFRCLEIMGSGGFLLSNFQADFLGLFTPGEDFVFYEDERDLLDKIDYYLAHEEERERIARNGHDKVASRHTYRHRVREMFDF